MFLDSKATTTFLLHAAVSSTGTSTTGHDTSKYVGDMQLTVHARTGGTNTATVTVKHCDTVGGTYATVPAEALVDTTGAEDTFDDISTTVYSQTKVLVKEYLKKYVQVVIAGTSLTHNIAIALVAVKRDSAL